MIKPVSSSSYHFIRLSVPYKYYSLFYKTRSVEIEFNKLPGQQLVYNCNLIDRMTVAESSGRFFYAYVELSESATNKESDKCNGHFVIDDLNIWQVIFVRF